jgi:histone deacetylase complex regulatory component SIN3
MLAISIDTSCVVQRTALLFAGHLMLLKEFNIFLPAGYRLRPFPNAMQAIITTPDSTALFQLNTGIDSIGVVPRELKHIYTHIGGHTRNIVRLYAPNSRLPFKTPYAT